MTFVDKLLIGLFSLFVLDTDLNSERFEIPFISMFIYLFILSATRTTFVHKVFGLVSYLPDVLVGWIGGHGQNLGDKQDEQKVSDIVTRSTGHMALASQSANSAVSDLANSRAQKNSAKQAELRDQMEQARHDEQIAAIDRLGSNTQQSGNNGTASKGNESSKF